MNLTNKEIDERARSIEALCSFQQMAMACSLDECLIAFHGFVLDDKQIEHLKIIHKSTRSWVLGRNTAILLKKIESPLISGKDAKDLTAAIVEHLQETPAGSKRKPKAEFNVYLAKAKE